MPPKSLKPGRLARSANPGDELLRFVAFNINPEGVPAVLPGGSVKAR
jgi:hypothetical protein